MKMTLEGPCWSSPCQSCLWSSRRPSLYSSSRHRLPFWRHSLRVRLRPGSQQIRSIAPHAAHLQLLQQPGPVRLIEGRRRFRIRQWCHRMSVGHLTEIVRSPAVYAVSPPTFKEQLPIEATTWGAGACCEVNGKFQSYGMTTRSLSRRAQIYANEQRKRLKI